MIKMTEKEDTLKKLGITNFTVGKTIWSCPKCLGSYGLDDNGSVIYNTCLCNGRQLVLPRLTPEFTQKLQILQEDIFEKCHSSFDTQEEDNFFYSFFDMIIHIFQHKEE